MVAVARKYFTVALLLAGSAILLFSCEKSVESVEGVNTETLKTEHSENLSIVMSENGRKSYFFKTPLLEGYTLAKDPYREFRRGIDITTYQDDSMMTVNSTLVANYAIYYENRKLWEAKGDVVVEKADGTKLYTQQLFWNSMTKRIYSNVDTKIVKGSDVFFGEGFESDEELKQWRFRRMSGKMWVNVAQDDEDGDESPKPRPAKTEKSSGGDGMERMRETPVSRSDYYGSGSPSPRPRVNEDLLDGERRNAGSRRAVERPALKMKGSVAGERIKPENSLKGAVDTRTDLRADDKKLEK